MAVGSLVALLAVLGLVALLNLQPWADDSLAPRVSVAPGLGVALGDAVAVAPGRRLAVAAARPAAGGNPSFVANPATDDPDTSVPEPAIAPARVVVPAPPARPPEGSPAPPPSEPLPPPPPSAEAVPVANPSPSSPAPTVAPPSPTAPESSGGHPGRGTAGLGPIDGSADAIEVREGDEYALSFAFYVQPTALRLPATDNLVLQFRGESSEEPTFALQLWDDGTGQRGLWSSGDAMDGERFLAPLAERVWHEVVLHFQASSEADGFYLLLLDGQPVDARAWVSLIESGGTHALLDPGLFRDGEHVTGSAADVLFGPIRLDESLEPVLP